jgi:hypothetical protein
MWVNGGFKGSIGVIDKPGLTTPKAGKLRILIAFGYLLCILGIHSFSECFAFINEFYEVVYDC